MTNVGMTFIPVSKSVVDGAFKKALAACQEQMLTDCNTYVKYVEGTLERSSQHSVKDLTLELSWDTPYARRQWYTGEPSEESLRNHPKASIMWAEKAAKEYKDEWRMILEKGMEDRL